MIALLDYGAGNLRSVANALRRIGADFQVTDRSELVLSADKVIFPGVGAAASCMADLRAKRLDDTLRSLRQPLLGICLGMQVLADSSEEGKSRVECLGVIPGYTARFRAARRLPQIGWNTISRRQDDPILDRIEEGEFFYFLHSYRVHTDPDLVIAETDYYGGYPSVVRNRNYWGVQFHPEKSGRTGLQLLRNFVESC